DLWHLAQLFDPISLHHPLGAERKTVFAAKPVQVVLKPVGRPRVDGRAQYQQLLVADMRKQTIDAALDFGLHRIEEFIDRRADGDNDGPGATDLLWRRCENESLALQGSRQKWRRAMLDKRQLPR